MEIEVEGCGSEGEDVALNDSEDGDDTGRALGEGSGDVSEASEVDIVTATEELASGGGRGDETELGMGISGDIGSATSAWCLFGVSSGTIGCGIDSYCRVGS